MRRLILISFLLISSLFFGNVIQAQAQGSISVEQEQPVYDVSSEEVIGHIQAGEVFPIVAEYEQYYVISIETATGYILKNDEVHYYNEVKESIHKKKLGVAITRGETAFYTSPGAHKQLYVAQPNRRFIVTDIHKGYYEVQILGMRAFVKKEDMRLDRGIPVLLYHHLLTDEENKDFQNSVTVSPNTFKQHMTYVAQKGYTSITLPQLEAYINGELNLPANVFALTFDDGLLTTKKYAYPILQELDFTATNFMITARIGKKAPAFDAKKLQFLGWDDMKEVEDVFSFEGHTHNLHWLNNQNCGALVCEPADIVAADLAKSMAVLPQSYFAYPFGQYNEQTIQQLKNAGIRMGFTTKKGFVQVGDDAYRLNRIDVKRNMKFEEFKSLFY